MAYTNKFITTIRGALGIPSDRKIEPHHSISVDYDADSLDTIELTSELEDAYSKIPDKERDDLFAGDTTVDDIADYLEKKKNVSVRL